MACNPYLFPVPTKGEFTQKEISLLMNLHCAPVSSEIPDLADLVQYFAEKERQKREGCYWAVWEESLRLCNMISCSCFNGWLLLHFQRQMTDQSNCR